MLSTIDLYAIARATSGVGDWKQLSISEPIRDLLSNVSDQQSSTWLLKLLGPNVAQQVLALDPAAEPPRPAPTANLDLDAVVPELPAGVRLTAEQERMAADVGQWERDFTRWASAVANETPILFNQVAGLFLGGLAIGRRAFLASPWGTLIHPNLYVMSVAVSTYYRKSTALNLAAGVAHRSIPHMLMPEPGSPENFTNQLAGIIDMEALRAKDKARFQRALPFAAQRGLIRDEIAGLFRSMGRDYMAGMKEKIMTMYDCPKVLDSSNNTRGIVVINNIAFSMMGSTTPAGLSTAISAIDWRDGNMARFLLATPEPDYKKRPYLTQPLSSADLEKRLAVLHEKFPVPPSPDALGDQPDAEEWSLVAPIWKYALAYCDVLTQMTAPGSGLDDRLRALYGRLHTQGLKIAVILTCQDWADDKMKTPKPEVTPAHWFRAQQIVEQYRASAHRLLHDLDTSEYADNEQKVRGILDRNPEGVTRSVLLKASRLQSRQIDEVIECLIEAGEIGKEQANHGGRNATIYRLV